MKIAVDGVDLFELSETQKKVLADEIYADQLDGDMKRRLQWVLNHKYERCLDKMKRKWLPLLKQRGVASIPLDNEAFAQLVFSQADYKDRSAREAEKKAQEAALSRGQ